VMNARGVIRAPRACRWRATEAVAVALAVVLTASACATDRTPERVTLRVLNWATDLELASEQRIADRWAESRPGVDVIVESIASNYGEKLITGIASGTPPHVFLLDSPDVPALVDRGLVLDLAPYLKRVGYDPSAVFPEVLETFRRGNQIYGLPKGFTPFVLYYNKRLFRDLGVEAPPDTGWTWESFLATAKSLVEKGTEATQGTGPDDVFAINFPRQLYEWIPFVWSAGGDILSPDGTHTTGYLDSPATVETFEFLTSLVTEHRVAPPVRFLSAGDPLRVARFHLGRQGMLVSGHWQLPRLMAYAETEALEIGVASIPRRGSAPLQTALYASAWAVPVNTTHKRLAVELAAYLAGEEAQRVRAAERLEIAALRQVAEEVARADTLGIEAAFLAQVPNARPSWGATVMDFHEIEQMSFDIMDRALLEGEPMADVASEVAANIDRVIAR